MEWLHFSAAELEVLTLSLKVALGSMLLALPPALIFGLLLARRDFPGKSLLDGFLCLPLVLPPVTTGYLLLVCLGRRSWIGELLDYCFGVRLPFTMAGAIIASMVVSFPLVLRAVRIAFEMIDPRLEAAAGTLGAPPLQVCLRVTIPLALPGIINGALLGFARSMGEFGATITFAGNIAGETQTVPLAVYALMQSPGAEGAAFKLVILSVLISFAAMAGSEWLNRRARNRVTGGRP